LRLFPPPIRRWGKSPEPLLPAGGYSSAGQRSAAGLFFAQVLQGYRFANALSETGGKTVLDIRTRLEARRRGLRITGRKGYCTGSLYAHWIGILALDADDRAQLAFVPRERWADGGR
jgi:alkylation response protein AidB-like acyl-CoA dehydrogenase